MSTSATLTGLIRRLGPDEGNNLADADLLALYAGGGDQEAFTALVQRYGGLVLGVARRQLADRHLADDVFQATFLALARSAGRLRRHTPLANWLYTVALRQARRAQTRAARQESIERAELLRTGPVDPLAEISGRDLLRAIDEELARLPDRQRLPVLLCCVQGLTRDEAAALLGWSGGKLKGQLERGRRRLADRLTARGLAPSVGWLAPLAAMTAPAELVARAADLAAAPWSRVVPATIRALAAVAPRSVGPSAIVLACVLVASVVGWAVAVGGRDEPVSREEPVSTPSKGPAAPPAVAPDPPPDPLPAGSTLRFGTDRYRHGTTIQVLAVSPDGKIAVASSGMHIHGAVRGYDLTDGHVLYTLGGELSDVEAVAISPDGKTVATTGRSTIRLHEATTGKELRTIALTDTHGGTLTNWLVFSPDGAGVALTQGDAKAVILVDLKSGTVARTFPHKNVVFAAAFSPDGKRMAAGGYDSKDGVYFARLWDVATGKELHRLPHGDGGLRTLAFSPDGASLAGGGDGGWFRLWDVATGKELRSFAKDGYRVRSVAFARDGKTVAAAGDAIRLYDPATGAERVRIDRQATHLHFDPDGKALTAAVAGTISRWDAVTGAPLTPQSAGDSVVEQILVTPDGRHLITRGQEGDAHLWDPRTGTHLRRLIVSWQRGIAMSPDGRFLVWPIGDETVKFPDPTHPTWIHTGSRLRLYDVAEEKFIDRFSAFAGDAQDLAFLPDGKALLTVDHRDGNVRLWDVATGKVQRSFRVVRDGEKQEHLIWRVQLSPDGKALAVTYQRMDNTTALVGNYAVRLWDVMTGKELHDLPGHQYYVDAMAFSPDSRLLVTGSEGTWSNQLYVWSVATGQRVASHPDGLPTGAVSAAFSPDGLALATASVDGTIVVREVATWAPRAEFRGHRDRVTALVFGPDGRLYSGGLDTTVLAWDVRPPRPAGNAPLTAAWNTLTDADARAAFVAQGRFLAAADEAVEFLGGKLKPAESVAPERITRLIGDLGSADFATRERAGRELTAIGRPAGDALRAAEKSASPEARKRAADLLAALDRRALTPEEIRDLRAVEVLGWIGTPGACGLLDRLAQGDPTSPVTQAARQQPKSGRK